MATTYSAGDDIDAYCSKCKLVLAHVIIAMRGTKPARCECKTCNAVHAYKKEAPSPKKTSGARATRAATARQGEYDRVIEGRDLSQAVKYKISQEFSEEDVLDHAVFGLGVVVRTLSDKKIEVVFQMGTKVLVHAR